MTESVSDPASRDVADLMDLVASYRPDLLKGLLDVLGEAEATREQSASLIDLIAACGVAEVVSPCATAMAIATDLESLARTRDSWTHPAQIIPQANPPALFRLCSARIERESGAARERLMEILPRLERSARLAEKAASRRIQEATRQVKPGGPWP